MVQSMEIYNTIWKTWLLGKGKAIRILAAEVSVMKASMNLTLYPVAC